MKSTKRTTPKTTKKRVTTEKTQSTTATQNLAIKEKLSVAENGKSNAKVARKAKAPKATATESASKKSDQKPLTMVAVKVDVGYGKALFIRGQGLGLTWDKGLPLNCIDSSTWIWSANNGNSAAEFKVLINDEIWSKGENLKVTPGERIEIEPAF